MAALRRLETAVTQTLKDLATSVERTRERQRPDDTPYERQNFASLLFSIETRCQNLRATLKTIERERIAALFELSQSD